MNRRNFLRSLGIACATADVTPVTLLVNKPKTGWFDVPMPSRIEMEPHLHRVDVKWKDYYANGDDHSKELLKKFKEAFKNTKFKPPISVIFRGMPLVYQENLSL